VGGADRRRKSSSIVEQREPRSALIRHHEMVVIVGLPLPLSRGAKKNNEPPPVTSGSDYPGRACLACKSRGINRPSHAADDEFGHRNRIADTGMACFTAERKILMNSSGGGFRAAPAAP